MINEAKKQTKGERSQEKILNTAISVFAREGFQSASLQAIADECGLAQTSILYHFRSKNDLFEAVVKEVVKRNHGIVSLAVPEKGEARVQLSKHFSANLRWAVEKPHEAQIILLLYYFAANDPNFAGFYERIRDAARARIVGYLSDATPRSLAATLHDLLLGGIVNCISTTTPASHVVATERRWQSVFGALLPP